MFPILNPQLERKTRLVYTVGSVLSGSAFQSPQDAIEQAIADGADGANNAVISILGGTYVGNLTLTNGGIALAGPTSNTEVYIVGDINITNDPTGDNYYGISGLTIEGNVVVSGGSTGARSLDLFNVLIFNGNIDSTASPAGQALALNNCSVNNTGADVVNAPNTTCFFTNTSVGATITSRAVVCDSIEAIDCNFIGRIETVTSCVLTRVHSRVQNQVAFSVGASTAGRIFDSSVLRLGSSGPVIDVLSGALVLSGFTYQGSVSSPVLVSAGSVVYGTTLDLQSIETLPRAITNLSSVIWSGGGGGFGNLFCAALDVKQPIVVDRLQAWCSQAPGGAGGLALGIYDSAGARIDYSAISSPAVGVNTRTLLSGSRVLVPGQYYFGIYCNQNGARFALFSPALSETGMGFSVPNSGSLDVTGFPASVAGFLSNLTVDRYWIGGRNG